MGWVYPYQEDSVLIKEWGQIGGSIANIIENMDMILMIVESCKKL